MPVLVLGIEKPFWQDVLIEMVKKGADIGGAVVQYRDVPGPNQFFENFKGKLVDGKKFYRIEDLSKLIAEEFGSDFLALSDKLINAFTEAERDFYILTDRFSYLPKSFRYRKRLFRESLRYWLAFYREHNITSLLFDCTPHNLSDYGAFHVAKYLGIPTLIMAHTMINDHILIRYDYRGYDKVPDQFMAAATEAELIAEIPVELYKAAISSSKVLQIVIEKNDASVGLKNLNVKTAKSFGLGKFGRKTKALFIRIDRFVVRSPKFKTALAMNGIYSRFIRRRIKQYEIIRYKAARKKHDALAGMPDLNCKYIYFAMHLQPERTSTPEAELFEDHLLAIEILAKAMPDGWKLYIKENPRQYDRINLIKGRHQRDVSDYQDFLKIPNVHLISQSIPSRDMIKNAQVVSTLSGSVGWEALQLGRPCVIFANAWYSAHQSAYRVESVVEAKAAIENCVSSTPEKVKLDLLRFLAFMKNRICVGNMGTSSYLKSSTLPYPELVERMSQRVFEELQSLENDSNAPLAKF